MKKVVAPPANETVSIRRISWADLWKLRPDLRPANPAICQPTRSARGRRTGGRGGVDPCRHRTSDRRGPHRAQSPCPK